MQRLPRVGGRCPITGNVLGQVEWGNLIELKTAEGIGIDEL